MFRCFVLGRYLSSSSSSSNTLDAGAALSASAASTAYRTALYQTALPGLEAMDEEIKSSALTAKDDKSGWSRIKWLAGKKRKERPGAAKRSLAAKARERAKRQKKKS